MSFRLGRRLTGAVVLILLRLLSAYKAYRGLTVEALILIGIVLIGITDESGLAGQSFIC